MPIKERHRLHLSGANNEKASDYNCLFHKKIRQYGIENFELIILEEVEHREDLDEREKYWIKEKNSYVKNNGYNLTLGGQKRNNNETYWDSRAGLNKEQVLEIIQLLKTSSMTQQEIADRYQISETIINYINSGKKYHLLTEKDYPIRKYNDRTTTQEEVETIIKLLQQGYGNTEIAKIIGNNLKPNVVSRINLGINFHQPNLSYPIRKDTNEKISQKEKANKVKFLLETTNYNLQEIANIVGIDRSCVSRINSGKNYHDNDRIYPIRK